MKNYYEILELDKTATQQEIKSSYRTLAKKYHPDKNQGQHAEKFRDIAEAYEILGKPDKRKEYDEARESGRSIKYDFSDFTGFEDYYEYFEAWADQFGFGSKEMKGSDINAIVRLTLEELRAGCKKDIRLKDGKIRITVPADTLPDTKIVIRGKGEESQYPEGVPGDLYVKIKALSHPTFKVADNNEDINSELYLKYSEFILGTTKVVPTLLANYKINIPKMSRPDSTMKLKGLGFKGGNMFIKLKLLMPQSLSSRELDLVKELEKAGL